MPDHAGGPYRSPASPGRPPSARRPTFFARFRSKGQLLKFAVAAAYLALYLVYVVHSVATGAGDHFIGLVVWGAVGLFGALPVALGVGSDAAATRTFRCPRCHLERTAVLGEDAAAAERCPGCGTYLMAHGAALAQVPSDTVESFPRYGVPRAAYDGHADAGGALSLAFPPTCALCGAPPSTQRPVEQFNVYVSHTHLVPKSISRLAHVAEMGNPHGAPLATMADAIDGKGPASVAWDARLAELSYPVCGEHAGEQHVVASGDGELQFRSYRYYRAFVELNHLFPHQEEASPTSGAAQ